MDVNKLSLQLGRLLREARKVARSRNVILNDIAEGKLRLTPVAQAELEQWSRFIREELKYLAEGVVEVKAIITSREDDWGKMPEGIRNSYSQLFERAYGTRALKLGDDVGKAPAKARRMRTTSTQKQVRGGAKPGKNPAASVKNVVIDHKAWQFKRTVDRRLRTLQSDIRFFLSGGEGSNNRGAKICPSCSTIGSPAWYYCPVDGSELKEA